jgi:hypothetical protein
VIKGQFDSIINYRDIFSDRREREGFSDIKSFSFFAGEAGGIAFLNSSQFIGFYSLSKEELLLDLGESGHGVKPATLSYLF